jgi:flagellar biosynthetic protein FliQ
LRFTDEARECGVLGSISSAVETVADNSNERATTLKEGCGFMTLDQATDLIRHTLVLALLISAPMLLIGMVVGIIVSLIQAVTQIQEQTLTFVPKIAAMTAAAVLLMPWIGTQLLHYAHYIFSQPLTAL